MKVKTAFSKEKDHSKIIAEIKQQIGAFDSRLILFFASPKIDPQKISHEIQNLFPGTPSFGCSSSGEIISGHMLDESIVIMAFGPEIIADCKIEVLENISKEDYQVKRACESFKHYFNVDTGDLPTDKFVGIVLIDGLSLQEEKINDRIGDLSNIVFIGGSAGDDLQFKKTYIYANGKSYTDAAVLCLIESKIPFDILKTQSFRSSSKKIIATKADESTRKLIEINNKPAREAYAELLEVTTEDVPNLFFSHPVGLIFGNDFFVRSPQRVEGNDIYFYCSIKEGMELCILDSDDIVSCTIKDLDEKISELGGASAILTFNCILRTLELKKKNQADKYADIFRNVPTIGFSTYGESYIGHINQTATMLLFK
jgi:hypothetical protein